MTNIALIGSRRVSILAVLVLIIVVWTTGSIDNANAADDDVDVDDARQGMKDDDAAAPTAASAAGGADEQDNDSIIPEAQIIETVEGLKRRIESDLIAEIGSLAARGATTEGEDGNQQQQQQQQKVSMMEELDARLDSLKQMMKRLEEVYMRYNNKQKETMRLIHEANEVQLEKFVERLDDAVEKEVSLRERLKTTTTTAEIDDSTQDGVDVVAEDELLPPLPEVTMKTLQEQLDIEEILEESEREITSWILQIAKHELDAFQHKTLAPATSAMKKKLKKHMTGDGAKSLSTTADDEDDGSCPTTGQIVEQVQVSLNKYADDGIGLVDYASQVSTTTTVVSMMTSETFQPPSNQKLGTAWFRSFIPEDWERHLLPDGWEEWNVGIPDYVYHSLGLSGASVVPPEAVLHPKVLPGSCWPMAGSKGQVTLKLEQPVVIDALTVDHVPTAIIPDGKQKSAPKRIVVVAYPPCVVVDDSSDNGACRSLGFDIHQEFEVARMTYDIEGDVSVQTFDSHYGQAIKNLSAQEEDDDDDDEEEEEDAGSCSTETSTSCSVPPRIPAAAVTFKVLENWGEPEFTCIYRLRVHGSLE
mmetsp:Transcript_23824/g.56241  ORF Transcript_23824/g.56241 Transcript_23824/m.56241 type:complete len:587 (+) Transcript_23824:54-1814(+)